MKQTKLFEDRYNRIMTKVSQSVRTILERLDEEELEDCFEDDMIEECGDMFDCENSDVNEMARKPRRSTIPENIEKATRDAIMRSRWNHEWAKQTKPLAKWSPERILQGYVFGLLLCQKECPKTVEDIDKIGVYANYAHKYLEEGGTIEDIIELYNQQDPVTAGKRSGATRARKAYRKPAEQFDFDNVENNEPETEETDVEMDMTFDDDAAADEVEVNVDDIEANDDVDLNDYPEYDEVDVDTEDDVEDEPVEEEPASDKIIIDDIYTVTYDDYMNPAWNNAFAEFDNNVIHVDKNGISIDINIIDNQENESEVYTIKGASFGDVLTKLYAIITASLESSDTFFNISQNKLTKWFYKKFQMVIEQSNKEDEMDDLASEVYETCFDGVKHASDVVARLKKFFK